MIKLIDYLYREDVPADAITDCSHQGPCDDDVAYWVKTLKFECDQKNAREHLAYYGAWSESEIADMSDGDVNERIFWLAMGNFKEGDDTFSLIG